MAWDDTKSSGDVVSSSDYNEITSRVASNTTDRHAEIHTVASHSDTSATGTELNSLTDNSVADTLHRHSELVASDGDPDPALSINDAGVMTFDPSTSTASFVLKSSAGGTDRTFIQQTSSQLMFTTDAGVSSIVMNAAARDCDFKVYGDTDTSLFVCDAGEDTVYIQGIPYASDDSTNVFIGAGAGDNNTPSGADGVNNILVGNNAGEGITSGANCVAIGTEAMRYSQTTDNNICIGYNAGKGASGNSYSGNIFIGRLAGLNTTTGNSNFFLGNSCGGDNLTGHDNVAIGNNAFQNQTDSDFNVMIGNFAGRGVDGQNCLNNVFIGYHSGFDITTGQGNVALGRESLDNNTSGSHNFALGQNTFYNNLTGQYNIGIGTSAGQGSAGNSHSNCIFIGYKAGFLNQGNRNMFIGYQCGDNVTTGTDNILIGDDLDASSGTVSNELNIGGAITGDLSTGAVTIATSLTAGTIIANNGWTGTFTNGDGATVTVSSGIITNVV